MVNCFGVARHDGRMKSRGAAGHQPFGVERFLTMRTKQGLFNIILVVLALREEMGMHFLTLCDVTLRNVT